MTRTLNGCVTSSMHVYLYCIVDHHRVITPSSIILPIVPVPIKRSSNVHGCVRRVHFMRVVAIHMWSPHHSRSYSPLFFTASLTSESGVVMTYPLIILHIDC